MPNPWIDSVRQTHQLTYYLNGVTGQWLTAVQEAVREFNAVSAQRNLGVTYVQSDQAPTDTAGADISIATANGSVTFNYAGSHQTTVNGRALQGSTLLISRPNGPIEKAFMFLPSQPMINTPRGQRATGGGVMKVIAFHELIHGCGLHNSDHTSEDVFNGFPSADPGRSAAQDRIQITVNGQYRFMPPILFSAITAGKISPLWQ
jgi:hypothetical protein